MGTNRHNDTWITLVKFIIAFNMLLKFYERKVLNNLCIIFEFVMTIVNFFYVFLLLPMQ